MPAVFACKLGNSNPACSVNRKLTPFVRPFHTDCCSSQGEESVPINLSFYRLFCRPQFQGLDVKRIYFLAQFQRLDVKVQQRPDVQAAARTEWNGTKDGSVCSTVSGWNRARTGQSVQLCQGETERERYSLFHCVNARTGQSIPLC